MVSISFSFCFFGQQHFIGLQGSLDYGYRSLKDLDGEYLQIKTSRDFFEYPSLGYTIGGNYNYKKNKISFFTDIQFSVRGYDENNTGQPQNSTFIPVDYQTFHYFRFIDLGLGLNIHLTHGKLQLFSQFGAKGNLFLSGEKRRFDFLSDGNIQESTTELDSKNFNLISFQVNGGLGLEYTHRDGLIFRFIPVFNYGLSPISSQPLQERLFSASAKLTALYELKSKYKLGQPD